MGVAAAAPWGGRGVGRCAGVHLLRGPLISLDPLGSCHPLLTQRGLGLQNQQGPKASWGGRPWGHLGAGMTPAGSWLVPRALEEKLLTGFQQGASTLPSHNHTLSPHKESHTLGAGPPEQDHLPTKWLSFSKSLCFSEPQFPHLDNGPEHIPSHVFVKCRTVPATVLS